MCEIELGRKKSLRGSRRGRIKRRKEEIKIDKKMLLCKAEPGRKKITPRNQQRTNKQGKIRNKKNQIKDVRVAFNPHSQRR